MAECLLPARGSLRVLYPEPENFAVVMPSRCWTLQPAVMVYRGLQRSLRQCTSNDFVPAGVPVEIDHCSEVTEQVNIEREAQVLKNRAADLFTEHRLLFWMMA